MGLVCVKLSWPGVKQQRSLLFSVMRSLGIAGKGGCSPFFCWVLFHPLLTAGRKLGERRGGLPQESKPCLDFLLHFLSSAFRVQNCVTVLPSNDTYLLHFSLVNCLPEGEVEVGNYSRRHLTIQTRDSWDRSLRSQFLELGAPDLVHLSTSVTKIPDSTWDQISR